jgi:hypothetical protein
MGGEGEPSGPIEPSLIPIFFVIGRVPLYIITNDYSVTPNYPSALMLLAKWFYPDQFADLDPQAAHQSM